ncbi:unnamed protein product, partial [Closterium sp. Naga37s-1]
ILKGFSFSLQSSGLFTFSANSFVEGEVCPFCESQVVKLCREGDSLFRSILYFYFDIRTAFKLPVFVEYYCTKGHIYGIRRSVGTRPLPIDDLGLDGSNYQVWLEGQNHQLEL